jgi:hypothetical protein
MMGHPFGVANQFEVSTYFFTSDMLGMFAPPQHVDTHLRKRPDTEIGVPEPVGSMDTDRGQAAPPCVLCTRSCMSAAWAWLICVCFGLVPQFRLESSYFVVGLCAHPFQGGSGSLCAAIELP